jgi:hypothetical protein
MSRRIRGPDVDRARLRKLTATGRGWRVGSELQASGEGTPGRLSWAVKREGKPVERLDVPHARLVEDLPGGRVRAASGRPRT